MLFDTQNVPKWLSGSPFKLVALPFQHDLIGPKALLCFLHYWMPDPVGNRALA